MNFFASILLLFVVASCSKPGSSPVGGAASEIDKNIVIFEEIQISVPLTGIPAAPVSLDFASLAYKQSGVQDLVLYNSASSGTITYLASDFDSSSIAPFTIKSNSCLSPLAGRKKCTISFSISNASSLPEPQTISSLFKVRGVDINLSAILDKDNTDYDAPVANITVTPSFLNFGTFKVGEFKELSLVVKNTALTGATPISVGTSSNPNIVVSSNLCPTNLANRSSCSIKLKYTGVAAETFANENLIKIANNQITYSGTVTSPSVEEPEVLQIEPAIPATNVAINQPDIQTGSIVFNNTGTLPLVAPVSGVSSDDGVVINSITCLGGLARSKSCTVNYTINSPALPAGVSIQTIKLQSGIVASESFSLNFDVVPNILPCTLADVSANGVNLLNSNSSFVGTKTGSDLSQCLLASTACNQYYSLATDSKSCQAVSSACLPADAQTNGWNITQALTISGNRSGTDITSCSVSNCNNEYLLNVAGKTCDGISCSLANAQGNGLSSILNVATVSGLISDDSCSVVVCDDYYQKAADNKSCSAIIVACNASDAVANSWNTTFAATYSGNKVGGNTSACDVATCISNYEISNKNCIPKICTPENSGINFSSIVSGNLVNGCSLVDCISGYEPVGGQCLTATACSVSDAINNGVIVTNSSSTIVGIKIGTNTEQCLLANNSCNPNYYLASNAKSCLEINYPNMCTNDVLANEPETLFSVFGIQADNVSSVEINQTQSIHANSSSFVALTTDGNIKAFGNATYGGNNSQAAAHNFGNAVGKNKVKQIYSTMYAWAVVLEDGGVKVWGDPNTGGNQTQVNALNFGTGAGKVKVQKLVSTGGVFSALLENGEVKWFGNMGDFEAGYNLANSYNFGNDPGERKIKQMVSNGGAFAYLIEDGTVIVQGHANFGASQATVDAMNFGIGAGKVEIVKFYPSVNYSFAALISDGTLRVWGSAGSGTQANITAFNFGNAVGQNKIKDLLSTGSAFAALMEDGSVKTWGTTVSQAAVDAFNFGNAVGKNKIKELYNNYNAFAALMEDGSVKVWGDSSNGGSQTVVNSLNFGTGAGKTKVMKLVAASRGFGALLETGAFKVWGATNYGGNQVLADAQNFGNGVGQNKIKEMYGQTKYFGVGYAIVTDVGSVKVVGDASSVGNQGIVDALGLTGNLSPGLNSCAVISCESGYTVSGDKKSCNP